jgi:carboxypeptidase PM20D1
MILSRKRMMILFLKLLLLPAALSSAVDSTSENNRFSQAALLLSKYLQIESVTGQEKPAGEFFVSQCRELGLQTRVFSDDQHNYNFSCSLYPLEEGKPNIILFNHIDVVPGGIEDHWRFPAFSGMIHEDTIWGRGAIDMKGMGIMQLMAAATFVSVSKEHDLPVNVTVLGVSGEEDLSSIGAELITGTYLKELNPLVVLGEGGSGLRGIVKKNPDKLVFTVSVADKKSLWMDLTFHYFTSGHGAVPPDEYANKMMVRALDRLLNRKEKLQLSETTKASFKKLGELEGGLRGFVLKNIGFFKPLVARSLRQEPILAATLTNTLTLTGVENPDGTTNQIPQEVTVELDCRLLPETDTDVFIQSIEEKLKLENTELVIKLKSPRSLPSERGLYYNLLEESLLEVYPGAAVMPILFPATTDNNYFRREGVPVYGITPSHLSDELLKSVHNANERIAIHDLHQGIEVYIQFISKLIEQYRTAGR